MKSVDELLRDADPIRHEPVLPIEEFRLRRRAILDAAASTASAAKGQRWRVHSFAAVAIAAIAISVLGSHAGSLFVGNVQAAVRFEVRLAEDRPGPGLREARVAGSDRSIYLGDHAIVSNSDIASAKVIPGDSASNFGLAIEFNASGARKMLSATGAHIGRPIAILIDGQVVMAPVLRSPISASAKIDGIYTRAQAERIVQGIGIK